MSIEGGNWRKKIEKGARMGLYGTMAIIALSKPEGPMAGKREAISKAEGINNKISDTLKPGISARDVPKDDPKDNEIQYIIREDKKE